MITLPPYAQLCLACLAFLLPGSALAATTVEITDVEVAGISGFRAHWNQPIPMSENGKRIVTDGKIKDRGQTAVWGDEAPAPISFDAVHRQLLVRFPGAAKQIADQLDKGQVIEKVELVLPYVDEEIWPQGGRDFPTPDGYRYRTNWGVDKAYRSQRPNWHAIAHALRKPWKADGEIGPTYNAAINGAVYWKRFGASDPDEDRFPHQFGPAEVSSYNPDGRMDLTDLLADERFGETLTDRLQVLADQGLVIRKWEVYDARFYQGAYDWHSGTGPRAIVIEKPKLLVTFKAGEAAKVGRIEPGNVDQLAAKHKASPVGEPTAVVPSYDEVVKLNKRFLARPDWMPQWKYEHTLQLMGLESGGEVLPFYHRALPNYAVNRAKQNALREAGLHPKDRDKLPKEKEDYAVYLAWLDWIHGERPRSWQGHLTAQRMITWWYNYRDAIPEPMRESMLRSWEAWLVPQRETAMTDKQRKDFTDTSGKMIHPMADDPRVGVAPDGTQAEWNQGNTYYKLTGDWRGNKSFFRSGFTRMISTANFNSTATSGALLCGQIIGSENAMADGRAGLRRFPFWMWTYNAGVGQEYIDHYYWAIATAGNKLFPDYAERTDDKMLGWSIINKTIEELGGGYHPNLKKLIGPASRTFYEHVLGKQDGLYHMLHVLSPQGALNDMETGELPALTWPFEDKRGRKPRPMSAWGHDYPPAEVAAQTLSGPWADPWMVELIDEKPIPWYSIVQKKVVAEGDWVTTYFGENYGLASIQRTPQRIHVLAHWRREARRPDTMRDIGTLDMRMGYNQTRIAEDGAGIISQQGVYRTYQHRNKLIMFAKPNVKFFNDLNKQDIRGIQCTAALFNYESPEPTWDIYVDDRKIDGLPATASSGQVITVRDGVTYLSIRPLPTTDLGRDVAVTLEEGVPQQPKHHENGNIQPALLINAVLYRAEKPAGAGVLERLDESFSGFAVEFGDKAEFGSFEKFREHIQSTSLDAAQHDSDGYRVTYHSGEDLLDAGWGLRPDDAITRFTVNGEDPYPAAEQRVWRDTPLSQMGMARRLEKGGAVIERGVVRGNNPMLLQVFAKRNTFVATNPVPGYKAYRFTTPDGVKMIADGLVSMGQWVVRGRNEIDLRYAAFELGEKHMPDLDQRGSTVFVTGTDGKPTVTLNRTEITDRVISWSYDGVDGWLIPLGDTMPGKDRLGERFDAAAEIIAMP